MKVTAISLRGALAALLVAAASHAALAHEGHDHGADEAAFAQAPAALPRFATSTERFELVGELSDRRLVLWLDRFADNAPVEGATLELEIGARSVLARPDGDRYVAELPESLPPGTHPITAIVLAGAEDELLAAELAVPAIAEALAAPPSAWADPRVALGFGVTALLAGAIGWRAGRRRA